MFESKTHLTEKQIAEQRRHFRISFQFDEWYVFGRSRSVAIHKFKTEEEAEALCDRLSQIPNSPEMNINELLAALGTSWKDKL